MNIFAEKPDFSKITLYVPNPDDIELTYNKYNNQSEFNDNLPRNQLKQTFEEFDKITSRISFLRMKRYKYGELTAEEDKDLNQLLNTFINIGNHKGNYREHITPSEIEIIKKITSLDEASHNYLNNHPIDTLRLLLRYGTKPGDAIIYVYLYKNKPKAKIKFFPFQWKNQEKEELGRLLTFCIFMAKKTDTPYLPKDHKLPKILKDDGITDLTPEICNRMWTDFELISEDIFESNLYPRWVFHYLDDSLLIDKYKIYLNHSGRAGERLISFIAKNGIDFEKKNDANLVRHVAKIRVFYQLVKGTGVLANSVRHCKFIRAFGSLNKYFEKLILNLYSEQKIAKAVKKRRLYKHPVRIRSYIVGDPICWDNMVKAGIVFDPNQVVIDKNAQKKEKDEIFFLAKKNSNALYLNFCKDDWEERVEENVRILMN